MDLAYGDDLIINEFREEYADVLYLCNAEGIRKKSQTLSLESTALPMPLTVLQ